jgi:ABC-2 type transport system permease protein
MRAFINKKNKALLLELVRTDFKLRYQGSALGYLWSLLKPLLLFVILYIVFVEFLRLGRDVPHFPVYLLLGIVLWNFFAEMTVQSLGSIVGRGDLIRKIRIPRWMIVVSSSISATINLLLSLVVVFLFAAIDGVDFHFSILWLPLDIVMLYILALGFSFFLAAAYVKFRDLSYIWEIVLQGGFYASAIIYPLSMVPSEFIQKILLLNPITEIIQAARYNMVTHETVTLSSLFHGSWWYLVPFALIIIIFVGGVWYFKTQADSFAENI